MQKQKPVSYVIVGVHTNCLIEPHETHLQAPRIHNNKHLLQPDTWDVRTNADRCNLSKIKQVVDKLHLDATTTAGRRMNLKNVTYDNSKS